MQEQWRSFKVNDPFERAWDVEFRWLQNAISIRHADAVDVKYYITSPEEKREVVIALPHPALLALARERGRAVTDAWCLRLAGLHLEHMISTWDDMDKAIVTVPARDLASYNAVLESRRAEAEDLAARTR